MNRINDEMTGGSSKGKEAIDLDSLISMARRRFALVAAVFILSLIAGTGYLFTAVPLYTASTTLLIDKTNGGLVSQMTDAGVVTNDEGAVLSEVEVLRSDAVALYAVEKYNLQENEIFLAPDPSLRRLIAGVLDVRRLFAEDVKPDANEARENAAAVIKSNMSVTRMGRTYVLNISYTSKSPTLSAKVVNAIAEGYLADKLNSKYDATRRASDWLQQRIDELREKALETDLAVQKYKSENGLLTASGQLVTEQQMSEISRTLITAQSETSQARARYERIKSIVDARRTDAIVTDVLDSSISNDLRKKYLDASKTEAEISARLGSGHAQAVRLRSQMAEYERLMFEELGRIAESYKSDYDVAQSKEKSLADSLTTAAKVSAAAGETQVQLRELERNADTYRNLYQTFLARHQEATQQQSFPITEARVIEKAQVPSLASYPQKPLTLALFGIMGLVVGFAFATVLEFRDRFFRTGDQVKKITGTNFLGYLPRAKGRADTYVVQHPSSMFAETLRAAKVAIDARGGGNSKVIGVISVLPGEGKSTVAVNFAQLLAMQGERVFLVDADLRSPGATKMLAPVANSGLAEVLTGQDSLSSVIVQDAATGLQFLPAIGKQRFGSSSQILTSKPIHDVLSQARSNADYVIIDLPPLGPVIDARAIAGMIDMFVLVIEWGETSRKAVQSILVDEPEIQMKLIGAVLSKVDTEKLRLYSAGDSAESYHAKYLRYYISDAK